MAKHLTFGERFLLQRRRRGLNQEEFGKLLGITARTVQNIETTPRYERKLKLITRSKFEALEKRPIEKETQV